MNIEDNIEGESNRVIFAWFEENPYGFFLSDSVIDGIQINLD